MKQWRTGEAGIGAVIGRQTFLLGFSLVVITLALYWPATGYDFIVYDDGDYVYDNPWVNGGLHLDALRWALSSTWACNWHPLTWISHMLDCSCYGLFAGGHHLTSIILHSLNTLMLFGLLQWLTKSLWASGVAAALFAWHPLHVESVAWVAERKDVLSTLFLLLTIWAYACYTKRPTISRYALALVLFALGLMSKPMLVTVPFVLLLLDYWPLGRVVSAGKTGAEVKAGKSCPALVVEKLPFFALALVASVITVMAQGSGGAIKTTEQVPWAMRVPVALTAYLGYLGKSIWPVNLSVFYPLPARPPLTAGVCSALGLAGITYVVLRWRFRFPWMTVGWLWFLVTLVPVIGIIQVGTQAMADRYTYIPMIGLLLLVVWSFEHWVKSMPGVRALAFVLAGGAVLSCLVLTRIQLSHWHDSIALFTHALSVTTNNPVAHQNLGVALANAGRSAEAIAHYQEVLRLMPNSAQAHYNLGIEMASAGKLDQATFHYSEALKLNPKSEKLHNNFGVILAQRGELQAAMEEFKRSIQLNPNYPKPYLNYGMAMQQRGLTAVAVTNYAKALELDSNWPEALDKLALLLATCPEPNLRNPPLAVELAERANQITRGEVPAYLDTLATAYAAAGNYTNAVSIGELALQQARVRHLLELQRKLDLDLEAYRAGKNPATDLRTPGTFGVQR
jgi:tetratricopeptide (TPR) repeat protein